MTRINLEHPSLLCNAHLVGEWYENPRVASILLKKNGRTGKIPMRFTVRTNKNPDGGRGHVTFFYNKLAWLRDRYLMLMDEMTKRGYSPTDNWKVEIFFPEYTHLFGGWAPTEADISLSRTRIAEMIPEKHKLTNEQLEKLSAIAEYEAFNEK
ncbi:endonuclease [Aeromonas phage L9-6]|nr:endonuclease [Aeromonas phage L9-6]